MPAPTNLSANVESANLFYNIGVFNKLHVGSVHNG